MRFCPLKKVTAGGADSYLIKAGFSQCYELAFITLGIFCPAFRAVMIRRDILA
jgi:hypothetical protein